MKNYSTYNFEQEQAWLAESLKEEGYEKYHRADNLEEKAEAMEKVIEGHYLRERQFRPWLSHEEYRLHFITANIESRFSDAIKVLAEKYGVVENPKIIKNHKSWRD